MRNILSAVFSFFALSLSPALAETGLFALSYNEVEQAVGEALADKGVAQKVAARVNGRNDEGIFSYSKPMTVELRGLEFDKNASHWSANILVVSEGEVVTAMPAAGRFDALAEVPVFKKPVKNGDVITAENIEIRDVPVSQTRADTVMDIATLIGQTPLRSISAQRPIRSLEIAQPPLVKKNSIVQMRYASPGMEIITSGQAMEDGAKGSVISVKNLASKKIVQATVEDVSTVSVSPVDNRQAERKPLLGDLYATN